MKANWRLINGAELYDLKTDPEQRVNVAAEFPDLVAEFKTDYDNWWEEISPTYSDQPYIIIGHESANPVRLFCHDWHSEKVSPWHQRHIRTGYLDNGYWMLKIVESGTYNLKLRRWPEELNLPLNAELSARPAISGTSVRKSRKGKVLNILEAGLSIQNQELSKEVNPNSDLVEFTLELEKGVANLSTWFRLENQDKIGAYFVSIEKK